MSRSMGNALPADVLAALAQGDLPARAGWALPVITLDAQGRAHPMLCSYLEVRAVDVRTVRLVVAAGSGSAENLAARRGVTLVVTEAETVAYVKCGVAAGPRVIGGLARFDLVVEDVLLDAADPREGASRVTAGMRFAPATTLDGEWARAVLEALGAE